MAERLSNVEVISCALGLGCAAGFAIAGVVAGLGVFCGAGDTDGIVDITAGVDAETCAAGIVTAIFDAVVDIAICPAAVADEICADGVIAICAGCSGFGRAAGCAVG